MAYIGNIPAEKYQTLQKQSFTTSATDTYTLSYAVTNPQDLALFINNVRQNPNDAYTVSGTTLTLSSAITSSDTMYAVFLGRAVETIAPATGSVTNSMLANSSITLNGSAVSLGGSATIGGGKIGQVVSTFVDTVVSITSTSTIDITGMSVSITPSATTSKILVINDAKFGCSTGNLFQISMFRDSTEISGGNNSGIGSRSTGIFQDDGTGNTISIFNTSTTFLDSPNSTSSLTYKLRGRIYASGPTLKLNATGADRNPNDIRTGSSITVMEVLA